MPLHIEMLADDDDEQKYAPICEDYWRQDEQGIFYFKIKEIANKYGMQPQVVSNFVEQRALVWLDEIFCPECKHHHLFGTRSQYQERNGFQNRVCASCLIPKHKTIAEKTNHLNLESDQAKVNKNVNLENIDLKSKIYFLSLLQALGNETLTKIWPLNNYPASTLSPDPAYDKKILSYLIDKQILLVDFGTHPDVTAPDDNDPFKINLENTEFELALENEEVSAFVNNFYDDATLNNIKQSDELIELCMEIQMHECTSFLDQALADHQIFSEQGEKTKLVFSQCLSRFSVSQIYSFIWSGVSDAAAFYNRYPIDMREAANVSIIYISRYMERALAHGWEIKPYYRSHNLPQSCLSRIVFNTILGTNDGGFKQPLHELIEIEDLASV
ncbi:hypothetical protein FEI13_05770 [Halomonas urmiana]|uniref:Uncharacterized protein n=1 Tax=Halomonas urmiana TaxID=490901 RepID=A0A5R8MJ64_9GAMM|nr:hypothetical protein [Halomonas urmiana]TLF52039.1 hypothetical protein FEI13_05770 [Halomonas urmiana]